eukprot:SAG31_NODE_3274_length_4475_cov_4.879799_2_plen_363_part_00
MLIRMQGPEIFWLQYPDGPPNQQTYHMMSRYRQGVVFDFKSAGSRIYTLELTYFVTSICNAVVLLGFAATITRYIAIYDPFSRRAKLVTHLMQERVTEQETLTRIGTRMVLSALNFDLLDRDQDHSGTIGQIDLLRMLCRTRQFTFEEAYNISYFVLHSADRQKERKRRKNSAKQTTNGERDPSAELNFDEYFSAQEEMMLMQECKNHFSILTSEDTNDADMSEREKLHKNSAQQIVDEFKSNFAGFTDIPEEGHPHYITMRHAWDQLIIESNFSTTTVQSQGEEPIVDSLVLAPSLPARGSNREIIDLKEQIKQMQEDMANKKALDEAMLQMRREMEKLKADALKLREDTMAVARGDGNSQ